MLDVRQPVQSLAELSAAVLLPGRVAVVAVDTKLHPQHNPKGNRPLTCSRHAACRRYAFVGGWTQDVALMAELEAQHGSSLTVGARMRSTTLCIDLDTFRAADGLLELLETAGVEPVIVKTPKGYHAYLSLPDGLRVSQAKTRLCQALGLDVTELDIRTDTAGQFVLAPGSIRGDGKSYELIAGIWGLFPLAPQVLLDLLDGPQIGSGRGVAPLGRGCEIRVASLTQPASRTYGSRSESLAAWWARCANAGLTVERAVELAYQSESDLTELAWGEDGRSRTWITEDAARVYSKLAPRGKQTGTSYEADETIARLRATLRKNQQRLADVLEWIVAKINRVGDPRIAFGIREIATHFGVDKTVVSRWLKALRTRGHLVRVAEHAYWDDSPEHKGKGHALPPSERRTGVYEVVGLRSHTEVSSARTEVLRAFGFATPGDTNRRPMQAARKGRMGIVRRDPLPL